MGAVRVVGRGGGRSGFCVETVVVVFEIVNQRPKTQINRAASCLPVGRLLPDKRGLIGAMYDKHLRLSAFSWHCDSFAKSCYSPNTSASLGSFDIATCRLQ